MTKKRLKRGDDVWATAAGVQPAARGQKSEPVSGSSSAITLPAVVDRKERNEMPAPLAPLAPLGNALRKNKLMVLGDVARSEIQWLVPDLIPLGSITVIDGQKGEGKSAIANDLAARVTGGKLMPLCTGEPISGGAILLQAEDDLGATVKASIEAAGGDPQNIRVYAKAESLHLDDPEDLSMIRQAAKEINARLLVADPFSEFFGKTLRDEKTIRNSFRLLRGLAADLQMAVILVRHFTKSGSHALYRGLGGVAVVNSARAALVVGHDPSSNDPYRHVLALNRCNLPRNRDISLVYRTVKQGDAIVIEWQGESKYSADDMVTAAQNPDDHSQLEEACYILYSILTTNGGPMAATDIYQAAKDGLVSVGTLKRAKKMLRVCSRRKSVEIAKNGNKKTTVQWVWQLPDDADLLCPYHKRLLREQGDDNPSTDQKADSDENLRMPVGEAAEHTTAKRQATTNPADPPWPPPIACEEVSPWEKAKKGQYVTWGAHRVMVIDDVRSSDIVLEDPFYPRGEYPLCVTRETWDHVLRTGLLQSQVSPNLATTWS